MQALIDTHTFIWFINGDKLLSSKARKFIEEIDNKCFISIASIWEIAIKLRIGKVELKSDFHKISDFLSDNDIEMLPIDFEHIQKLLKLDFHHRDPFDRIIIAQGISENLTILTKDEIFEKYGAKVLW